MTNSDFHHYGRLATNGHANGKLRFSAQDWIGPQHGDRGGTYWQSRKTGEKVYSPTNPGGQESQGEQPQQASEQGAKPDLKAIGAKYAQQAREKWGDKAHENLTKIASNLAKDQSPEAQKKLAAVKAMLAAVQAEQTPEQSEQPSETQTGNEQPQQAESPQSAPSEQTTSDPSPGEPILQPEKQTAVNERKRANMKAGDIAVAKMSQHADTERYRAEAQREIDDEELKEKRDKEDAALQEQRDAMTERHEKEIAEADDAITAAQTKSDEMSDRHSEEDDQLTAAREAEDDKINADIETEDKAVEKQRDDEDNALDAVRIPMREQLTAAWEETENGSPEEKAAKKALDAFEANVDKEDEKLATKREKEDDKRSAERDKAEEKLTAKRDKEDAALQKARDKEEADIDKEYTKLEAKKQALEEKHSKEIDDFDDHEYDIQADRDSEDEDATAARDEEDEYFDEEDSKEHDKATELIDSFEETDDAPAKSPEEQLDAVRKYNEMAAKTGKRNRIIWYEGKAFQGWANENIDNVSDDDFDRFCPLPTSQQEQPVQSSADYDGSEPIQYAEDRISLDELRRMPGPEASAYARGVLAMLARQPSLRREFSLQDLAYLQAIAQDVVRYESEGHWITIGGTKGSDGERHGGSPVFIQNGKITKGHPSLTGKKIGNLKEKAEGGSVRTANKQEADYGRAKVAKEARKQGIDPKHLHSLAAEIKGHHDASGDDIRNMLAEIKRDYPHLKATILSAERGGDSAAIKGLDVISQSLAHRPEYTHLFGGHADWQGVEEDHSEKLYEYLVAGAPAKMTEEDAYEQALDHIKRHKIHEPEEEPVPFAAIWDESEHPRDDDGRWATKGHIQAARKQLAKGDLKVHTGEATSHATGKPLKRWIELDNGARIHPDELHRTKFGDDDEPYVSTDEKLTVTDGNGTRQVKSFATALQHAGMSKGTVTIAGPHGYSVTLPGEEWQKADRGGKTFAEWSDEHGSKVAADAKTETKFADKKGIDLRRAPAGGAVSDVDGVFYRGGWLMPIHGLSPKVQKKPKGDGEGTNDEKPNEEGKGRSPRTERPPMTPEEIADEKKRREDEAKWTEMNAGPIGKFKWLGDRPNHKAATDEITNINQWKDWAVKLGDAKMQKIVDTLKPMIRDMKAKEIADELAKRPGVQIAPDTLDWDMGQIESRGKDDTTYFGRGHSKQNPTSLLARQYVQAYLGAKGDDRVEHMHKLNQILSNIENEKDPLTTLVSGRATDDFFAGKPAGQARLFAADYDAEEAL